MKISNHNSLEKDFNEMYESYADAVFRFCRVRISDREQAMDITQDTFSRFWQSLVEGGKIDYPRAFLFTIARNAIIDWYRKKKAISLESMEDPETEEPYEYFSDSALMDSKLESEGRFLLDKIGRLGKGNRDAVYLRFVEGLSPPEIGKILNVSTNAASVRINRGIEELRKLTGYDVELSDDSNGMKTK